MFNKIKTLILTGLTAGVALLSACTADAQTYGYTQLSHSSGVLTSGATTNENTVFDLTGNDNFLSISASP